MIIILSVLMIHDVGQVMSPNACPGDWFDLTIVNLGCIYLDEKAHTPMSYFDAYKFCWELDAVLLEVQNEQQLAYLDQILGGKSILNIDFVQQGLDFRSR